MNLFAWDLGGRCSQPSLALRLAWQGAAGLVDPTAVQRDGAAMGDTGVGNRVLHHPELAVGVSIGATQPSRLAPFLLMAEGVVSPMGPLSVREFTEGGRRALGSRRARGSGSDP